MRNITATSAHKRESNKMFLVVAVLFFLFHSLNVQAKEFTFNGLKYSTDGNNASVTGYTSIPEDGAVTIPESVADPDDNSVNYSVTSIGDNAFNSCSGLKSVTIGNSVENIGDHVFLKCSNLTEINVESGNTAYISENGILFNKDKTTIVCYPAAKTETTYIISNSVTSIGGYAFSCCNALTSVAIPNSVISIGKLAFSVCSGLTSVTIPNSVTSIGDGAFGDCDGLTSVAIPNSVTSIGDNAFISCNGLTSVTIPNSVTSIGNGAFYYCRDVTLYCEVEESSKPAGWDSNWTNRSSDYIKWGCKVIRAEADNAEYGSVSLGGENNAAVGANGSLWYLNETTNGTVTLTAAPTEGYHFVKWTSEGVEDITENPVTLDVTAGRTYTAVFESYSPTSVKYDEQSQINIFAVGKNIIIENADSEIFVTDISGREIAREMPARRNVISVAASGIYVVKVGKTVKRVLVK